jgi:hypothetical protein
MCLLFCSSPGAAQETEDYSIDDYELTFESSNGSSSLLVTLDITYLIKSGKKSTGFKYIGNSEVTQTTGRDGDGKPIRTWVEYQRETRLNWSFPPAGPGRKRLIISFTIANVITNAGDSNEFSAEWAGFFKVPVKRSIFRFVFPDNANRSVVVSPTNYFAREQSGRRAIEVSQIPLKQPSFELSFSPRIVNSSVSTRTSAEDDSSFLSKIPGNTIVVLLIGGIVGVIAYFARKAKRAGGSGESWWSSTSSCAGGSSCSSSSCGSSCGGGCGGGCGG